MAQLVAGVVTMRVVLVVLAAVSLGGCVSGLGRMSSYGNRLADAKTTVAGHGFSLWVHPVEDAILVQRAAGPAIGQGVLEGLSFGTANLMDAKPYWKQAAESLTSPLGCAVTDVYTLDNRTTWEAPYTCPKGVDLRGAVMSQRDALRLGVPIKP
jgi:hypothetical protein